MSQKPETRFKERVLRDLRLLPRTWCTKIQQVAIRGTPDVLACINGTFVALELKKDPNAHIDNLQRYVIARIVEAGGAAFITFPENWDLTLQYLKDKLLANVPPDESTTH